MERFRAGISPIQQETNFQYNVFLVNSSPTPANKETLARIRSIWGQLSAATVGKSLVEIKSMSFPERLAFVGGIAKREQERRWEETTGVKPEDTHFILGTPIYNETRMGFSAMAMASVLSDVPSSTHVDKVYVTNRCTDGSEQMVQSFLAKLGEVKQGLPLFELGDFSFDPQIDPTYCMVEVGNNRYIHINTKTGSKANVWRILTEMGIFQGIPIIMSYDTNVFVLPDGPTKLYREAYNSFVRRKDDAVIISAVTPEYTDPKKIDPLLQGTGLSPRQILPFGLLVPKKHQVNGKFAAWDPKFYTDRNGRGIPPSKLDDVVMAKQAEMYGKSFRPVNEVLSYEWGVPTLNGRMQMLKRYTIGYHQIANGLGLREVSPEIAFFEVDNVEEREKVLRENARDKPHLQGWLPYTIATWNQMVKEGYEDFLKDPHNPAFEKIEGSS